MKKTSNNPLPIWPAYDQLIAVRKTMHASIAGLSLLATDESLSVKVETLLKMKSSFDLKFDTKEIANSAQSIVDTAIALSNNNFHSTRCAGLVAVCAAMENLTKCAFVYWAESSPTKLSGLESTMMSILTNDQSTLPLRDRLFNLADRIVQDLSRKEKSQFARIRALLIAHFPDFVTEFDSESSAVETTHFDNAFLVRNCVVHSGGLPNVRKARELKIEQGESITLTKDTMSHYFGAIEGTAAALTSCDL